MFYEYVFDFGWVDVEGVVDDYVVFLIDEVVKVFFVVFCDVVGV